MIGILKFINNLISNAIILVCVFLLLISGYCAYDNYYMFNTAVDKSLLVYRPEMEVMTEEKKITDKQVAWLCIEDTGIDFPIMQGSDNFEFLNINPYGEFSMGGSIFLDSNNTRDFSDEYNLLYGHHMTGKAMFGALDYFLNEDYFQKHSEGVLITEDGKYRYRLFAVAYTDAYDKHFFNMPEATKSKVMSELKNCSIIYTEPLEGERLLAMSTCAGEKETSRLMVFGTLSEFHEQGKGVTNAESAKPVL